MESIVRLFKEDGREIYQTMGRRLAACLEVRRREVNLLCGVAGFAMLTLLVSDPAFAQHYNTKRLENAVNVLFTYIEGSFGALVMVCAGVGAILSSAFGQYRSALGLMVVALGSFTLRSFVATFFNDKGFGP